MSELRPVAGPYEPPSPPYRLVFGEFELDAASGELRGAGRTVHLEPQPAKVLLFLLERAGQVVRRKDLHRHLWGDGRHVEADQGLNYCIKELRNALGDSAREPRYIETLRRRGYRFLVPAEATAGGADRWPGGELPPGPRAVPPIRGDGDPARRWWAGLRGSGAVEAVVLVALLLAALGVRAIHREGSAHASVHPPAALRIAVLPFETCGRGDEEVSRGVPAAVISHLADLSPEGMEVAAATSSFAYAGRSRTAREIGRELRVSYVVEGTFHHVDGEPRLDVRLVDTEEDAVVWTGSYRADSGRLDELAATLAESLADAALPGADGSRGTAH